MAALRIIVIAQGVDRAHAENEIVVIPVQPGPYVPAEIECDGGVDAEGEGTEKGGEAERLYLLLDSRNNGIDEGKGLRGGERIGGWGFVGTIGIVDRKWRETKENSLLPWWAIRRMLGSAHSSLTACSFFCDFMSTGIGHCKISVKESGGEVSKRTPCLPPIENPV